jgi:hypothetical protein
VHDLQEQVFGQGAGAQVDLTGFEQFSSLVAIEQSVVITLLNLRTLAVPCNSQSFRIMGFSSGLMVSGKGPGSKFATSRTLNSNTDE